LGQGCGAGRVDIDDADQVYVGQLRINSGVQLSHTPGADQADSQGFHAFSPWLLSCQAALAPIKEGAQGCSQPSQMLSSRLTWPK